MKLTEESLMPYGKFKDFMMIDIPAKYLLFMFYRKFCTPEVKEYIQEHLEDLKQEARD